MVAIKDLFDLDKTIARELFEGKTYPWEVLDEIKPFILKLGASLDPAEYDQPYEGVWVAKDATVFPSAYLGAPCIIDHGAEVRHCAFIRGSAIVGKNAVVGNSVELKNVVVTDKDETLNCAEVKAAVKKVEADLGDEGRVVLRKSGTEPLLRVMVEATSDALCEEKVDEIIAAMQAAGKLIKVK